MRLKVLEARKGYSGAAGGFASPWAAIGADRPLLTRPDLVHGVGGAAPLSCLPLSNFLVQLMCVTGQVSF